MTREQPLGFDAVIPAPFGALGLRLVGEALSGIGFLPPGSRPQAPEGAAAREAARQIAAYLADPRIRFDLPLARSGTPFQRRVWAAMARIPRGETRTYGELAAALGSAARAVGQACGANPLPVVVPCHRVVGSSGIGGFAGATRGFLVEAKRWLLAHEARAAA
ncbi:MAG: methylated-DNA--[protein]-cysteine S-methyltransferase [Burkholderiales bacterium]|nr:methylated-DNA--[protein]-cysteine S-methyltransferase [Burkholderiales bacterium]